MMSREGYNASYGRAPLDKLCRNVNTMTLWDLIKDISQVLTPVVIGLLVVYIAYQQQLINKRRLKFELYEKRFNVYRDIII